MIPKIKYLLWLTVLFSTVIICGAFVTSETNDFNSAKQQILLRKIGHQILLQSGDSLSRVLPVKQIARDEYQLKFENQFSFSPDSLYQIVKRSLSNDALTDSYVVNVVKCSTQEVVYGYLVLSQEKNDVVPCSGRNQPKDCYLINIKFEQRNILTSKREFLVGSLGLIASCGLLIGFRLVRPRRRTQFSKTTENQFVIGATQFDVKSSTLRLGNSLTPLTAKENKLLLIFARSPNTIIERSQLQKEIWEDEGVIVGRSLDMFISKLRKKLQADTSITLTNIHGKGYKLEVPNVLNPNN